MAGHGDWNRRIIDEFRANSGRVQGFGRSLVILHHVGARSGQEHETPVMAIREGDDAWLIAASAAGSARNPAWYHNLIAHPDLWIETPQEPNVRVQVRELTGSDRDEAWLRFVAVSEGFAAYQQKTTRTIPVLVLTRS